MDKKDKDVYYSVWEVSDGGSTRKASMFSDVDKDTLCDRDDFDQHHNELRSLLAKQSKVSIYACLMVSITKVK